MGGGEEEGARRKDREGREGDMGRWEMGEGVKKLIRLMYPLSFSPELLGH